MQLLIHISRRFCNFTRCSQSSGDNEGTIRVVGQGENEGNIGIGSIWEEKQILLLQKLSDYTVGLTKRDFHEYHCENPEETCVYDDDFEQEEKDLELGDGDRGEKNNKTIVSVPSPGNPAYSSAGKRNASTLCAICLCPYEPGDRVCWSSNPTCPHVFHEECIVPWFTACITKQRTLLRRRRERERRNRQRNRQNNTNPNPSIVREPSTQEQPEAGGNSATEPTAASQTTQLINQMREEIEMFRNLSQTSESFCTDFLLKNIPKECPCCRQDFFSDEVPSLEKKQDCSQPQKKDAEADAGTLNTSGSITNDGSSSFDSSSDQNISDGQEENELTLSSV